MASVVGSALHKAAGMTSPADPIIAPVEIPTGALDPWSPEARREYVRKMMEEQLKDKHTSIVSATDRDLVKTAEITAPNGHNVAVESSTAKVNDTKIKVTAAADGELAGDAYLHAVKDQADEVALAKKQGLGSQANGEVQKKKPGRKPGPAAAKKAERAPKRAATETGEPRRSKRNRL